VGVGIAFDSTGDYVYVCMTYAKGYTCKPEFCTTLVDYSLTDPRIAAWTQAPAALTVNSTADITSTTTSTSYTSNGFAVTQSMSDCKLSVQAKRDSTTVNMNIVLKS
jgi:hypothetical protein